LCAAVVPHGGMEKQAWWMSIEQCCGHAWNFPLLSHISFVQCACFLHHPCSTPLRPSRTIQTNPQSTVHELLLRHSIIPIKFRALSRNRFALTFLNLYFAQLPPLAKFYQQQAKGTSFLSHRAKIADLFLSLVKRFSRKKDTMASIVRKTGFLQ